MPAVAAKESRSSAVERAAPARAGPCVTVLMPVRNEARHIAATLTSLLAQDLPPERYEIVVMDGRSTDGTQAILAEFAARDARVRWFDNPGVIVSTALNRGFSHARGEWIARADGHSNYAPDYLRSALATATARGADVVGGPMVARGELTPFQHSVAVALGSRFGMGGAAFHFADRSGPAESVYLGFFRADALRRFGPFHEELVRNQDDEWFARARSRGATVWLDASIRSSYSPRRDWRSLLRQYFEYGLYKPAALRCVPGSLRARQLAPSALLLALLLPLVAGIPSLAAAAAVAYAGVLAAAVAATRGERQRGWNAALRLVGVLATMHLGYGAGFLAGLFRRARDGSTAAVRAVYRRYAADPDRRAAWSEQQPGQRQLVGQRDAALARALRDHFGERPAAAPLRVLDLGAGDRNLATALAAHGAPRCQIIACDLLAERLAAGGAAWRVAADSRQLPFADGTFDVVVQCTMLSSVPAAAARRVIASEMTRVCRDDGLVLSYDARIRNPFNRQVRPLARDEHAALFPGRAIAFERLTPLPPLARRLPRWFPRLARCAPLCLFDLASVTARGADR
ncbi:MAG: glycosyltransferase [Planctomycetes bacterium]|nr:glycosyltransferase [Planctomycetota bacterium]